jgi:diacylglycerol kinase (ATP)
LSYAKVIVNPSAGAGKTKQRWPVIRNLLETLKFDFSYSVTEYPGHAIELAKSAALEGHQMVVSIGGDGTVSEVANGLYQAGLNKEVLLGIVSTGTGSDYIRTLNIPRSYQQACRCLIEPHKFTVDAGLLECVHKGKPVQRLFVNFAGLGFDAEIVRATTQTYKSMGAKASYLMGLFTTLAFFRNQEIDITLDDKVEMRKVCTVVMGNGKYAGGGMFTTPNAELTDGLFDVLIVGDLSKIDLLKSLPTIYKGTHLSHPKITVKRAREVMISPRQQMGVQADGDLLGEAPVGFSILPSALNLVV